MTPWKSIPNLDDLGRRFRRGESMRALARETGIEYATLRRQFEHRGYHQGRCQQPLGREPGGFIRVPNGDPLLAALRKAHP